MEKKITTKKIIFRADGNSNTGLGHLYRLFALVEIYKSDFNIVFVTREDTVLEVIPSAYPIEIIPKRISLVNESKWLKTFFNPKNCTVIADGYQFVSSYQKSIKEEGFSLIYIDDLTTEYMYADLVINHSPFVKKTDFKSEVYTNFLLGTDYAMLRPLFLKAVKEKNSINKINTVFVCFGGADFFDLSLKTAKALLSFDEIIEINVIIGGAYKHKTIFELAKENQKVKLYSNLDEITLFNLIKKCNFGVVPCSTISYEVCCVGLPFIGGYYVENQKNIYKGFLNNNIFFDGDNYENKSVQDFQELIQEALNTPLDLHNQKLNNQYELFNKNQKKTFLSLLK
tara:strand:+ start:2148 stop:3170 length:1023 start_codon:yes stop_codon:yes gene_type:complete